MPTGFRHLDTYFDKFIHPGYCAIIVATTIITNTSPGLHSTAFMKHTGTYVWYDSCVQVIPIYEFKGSYTKRSDDNTVDWQVMHLVCPFI